MSDKVQAAGTKVQSSQHSKSTPVKKTNQSSKKPNRSDLLLLESIAALLRKYLQLTGRTKTWIMPKLFGPNKWDAKRIKFPKPKTKRIIKKIDGTKLNLDRIKNLKRAIQEGKLEEMRRIVEEIRNPYLPDLSNQ